MKEGSPRTDDKWLHRCNYHRRAQQLVAQIHTRMPVILGQEHHEAWLSNDFHLITNDLVHGLRPIESTPLTPQLRKRNP
jgi:putative SOS response-associated peptidase YedK